MTRLLPFLLALLVADLAGAGGTDEQQQISYVVSITAPPPPLPPGQIRFSGVALLKCVSATNGMPYMETMIQTMETNGSVAVFATSEPMNTSVTGDRSSNWKMVVMDKTNAVITAMQRFGEKRFEAKASGGCSMVSGDYHLVLDQPIPKPESFSTTNEMLSSDVRYVPATNSLDNAIRPMIFGSRGITGGREQVCQPTNMSATNDVVIKIK